MSTVQRLMAEQVQGLEESTVRLKAASALVQAAGGKDVAPMKAVAGMEAWTELVELWHDLSHRITDMKQRLEAKQASVPAMRSSLVKKALDGSVEDAERKSALAEAVRRASNFDEELERQRQRLSRRKKVAREDGHDEVSKLLDLGQELELEALASEHAEAAASCREHLSKADAVEAEGWQQVLELYEQLQAPLDEAKDAVKVAKPEPSSDIAANLVGLELSLLQLQEKLCSDLGPVDELHSTWKPSGKNAHASPKAKREVRDVACQTVEEQRTRGGEPDLEQLLAKLEQVSGTPTRAKPIEKIEEEVTAVVQRWRLENQWRKRRWNPGEGADPSQLQQAPTAQQVPVAAPQVPATAPAPAVAPQEPPAPAAPPPQEASPPTPPAAVPLMVAATEASHVTAPTRQEKPQASQQEAGRSQAPRAASQRQGASEEMTSKQARRRRRNEVPGSDEVHADEVSQAERRRASEGAATDDLSSKLRPQPPSPPPAAPALNQDHADLLHQLEHQTRQPLSQTVGGIQSGSSLAGRSTAPALPSGRPSSAVARSGGGLDPSRLAPPTAPGGHSSRSVSPSSSAASTPTSGINQLQKEGTKHRPGSARLDPIARPRGPPLPNAGRLLLTGSHQESPSHDVPRSPSPGLH